MTFTSPRCHSARRARPRRRPRCSSIDDSPASRTAGSPRRPLPHHQRSDRSGYSDRAVDHSSDAGHQLAVATRRGCRSTRRSSMRRQSEEDVRHRPVRDRCRDDRPAAGQGHHRDLLHGDGRVGELPARRRRIPGGRARQRRRRVSERTVRRHPPDRRAAADDRRPARPRRVQGLRRDRTRPRRHIQRL